MLFSWVIKIEHFHRLLKSNIFKGYWNRTFSWVTEIKHFHGLLKLNIFMGYWNQIFSWVIEIKHFHGLLKLNIFMSYWNRMFSWVIEIKHFHGLLKSNIFMVCWYRTLTWIEFIRKVLSVIWLLLYIWFPASPVCVQNWIGLTRCEASEKLLTNVWKQLHTVLIEAKLRIHPKCFFMNLKESISLLL